MSLVFCLCILFHPHNGPIFEVKKLRTEKALPKLTAGKQQGWKLNPHLPSPYSVHLLLHLLRPVLLVTKSQIKQQTRLTEPHPQARETMIKILAGTQPRLCLPRTPGLSVFRAGSAPTVWEKPCASHSCEALAWSHVQTVWLELNQPVKHIGLLVTHPAVQADPFKGAPEPAPHCAVELERDQAAWELATQTALSIPSCPSAPGR